MEIIILCFLPESTAKEFMPWLKVLLKKALFILQTTYQEETPE